MSFSIEQPEVVREKYYPEYLQEILNNFKAKHAIYKIKRGSHDESAVDFYKLVRERELKLVHEITRIHRVKVGGKEKLVYGDNLHAIDKNGNEVRQFYSRYGFTLHPIIKEDRNKNGDTILVPGGIKLEHQIDFNEKEVNKIIEMCHPDYRDNIKFSYCEVPMDSATPINLRQHFAIKSEELFKTAPNKIIKKMIERKMQNIEELSELNGSIVIPKSSKA